MEQRDVWYRVIDPVNVPEELRCAGDKMLAFVKTDLQLPNLKVAWCVRDTKDNERADTERRFKVASDTGVYHPTPYRTEEAYNFPALTELYILADGAVDYSVRHIAFRAKIFQIWQKPFWYEANWKNGDPDFDPYAYAEQAALRYEFGDASQRR